MFSLKDEKLGEFKSFDTAYRFKQGKAFADFQRGKYYIWRQGYRLWFVMKER